jgi:hypothetical protein
MGAQAAHLAQQVYADPAYRALSETIRHFTHLCEAGEWRGVMALFLRRLGVFGRGLLLLARAPRTTLRVNDGPAGRAIAAQSGLARALLVLPSTSAEYLKRRSRQAVRTNCRRAREQGVVCREVARDDQDTLLARFLREGGWTEANAAHLEQVLGVHPGEQRFFVAEWAGCPLALAVLEVDERAALLVFHHALPDHALSDSPLTSWARYALGVHVIEALIVEGVSMLLVGGTLRLAPGLQYFQQRLGFGVWHVRTRFRSGSGPQLRRGVTAVGADVSWARALREGR